MPDARVKVLIVDDKANIRKTMCLILAEIGYNVSSATDGFSALREIRRESPAILLSDLNMPGMTGFELLVVVRRRFPEIQVIAMSGSFSGIEVPSGIPADAFYQKGSSMVALLQILRALPQMKRRAPAPPRAVSPLWIQCNDSDPAGSACVSVTCPECLRSFSQPLTEFGSPRCEVNCIHCGNPIQYALVEPSDQMPPQGHRREVSIPIAVQAASTSSN
jgi:CheY-like chemotaxis protein